LSKLQIHFDSDRVVNMVRADDIRALGHVPLEVPKDVGIDSELDSDGF
jgi:hypothetical protein